MTGILYVVATPIGNLEDVTYRAVRVLQEVDLIACEDTRETRKLLNHYSIDRPLVSYHEHNEASRAGQLLDRLRAGGSVALVSDAGTPLISDPGYRIVSRAAEEGIRIVPIPGASAVMAALAAAGLPTDAFFFAGFLPAKSGQRRKSIEGLRTIDATVVLYEAPHRILETLSDLEAILGDRPAVLARELTKLHEEILRGTISDLRIRLAARPVVKGEITLVIGKSAGQRPPAQTSVAEAVDALVSAGADRMAAIKEVAKTRGLSKRDVYREVTRAKAREC